MTAVAVLMIADAAALTLVGDGGGTGAAGDRVSAEVPNRAAPTSTTTAPPLPQRVAFSIQRFALDTLDSAQGPPSAHSVLPDGSGLRAEPWPAVPDRALDPRSGRRVYSKTIKANTYEGCGFAGCSRTTTAEAGIAIANADGTGERLLTTGGYDQDPTWSPDGSMVAFSMLLMDDAGQRFNVVGLVEPDADVEPLMLDIPPTHGDGAPAWSPDGRSIAVTRSSRDRANPAPQVVVVGLDGSEPRAIAEGGFAELSWSPDGTFLVGVKSRLQDVPGSGLLETARDVWLIPVDGSGARPLTSFAPAVRIQGSASCSGVGTVTPRVQSPLVSPDSSLVAFGTSYPNVHEGATTYAVAVIAVDGSGYRVVRDAMPRACTRAGPDNRYRPGPTEAVELLGWRRAA